MANKKTLKLSKKKKPTLKLVPKKSKKVNRNRFV